MAGTIERQQQHGTVVIANGATASAEILLLGYAQGGFALPAAFTGASISFQVARVSGGTFLALRDDTNTVISITVAVSVAYPLPVELFAGWAAAKIVSASAEGAARTLEVVLKS